MGSIIVTGNGQAFAASSANYSISIEVFDLGGGTAESTNYQLLGKARPHQPKDTASTNYKLWGGFLNAAMTGAAQVRPTITSITPNWGYVGDLVTVEVIGTNISTDATVALVRGATTINGNILSIPTSTEITAEFNLLGATAGFWNVRVTNAGSLTGTLVNGFQVRNAGIEIVGVASNEPNPFDPKLGSTQIRFNLSAAAPLDILLINQVGEVIWKTHVAGVKGDNVVTWNGSRTDFSDSVPSGVYLCRIVSGGKQLAKVKIAVLRRK